MAGSARSKGGPSRVAQSGKRTEKSRSTARLGRVDWMNAALEVIAEDGLRAVAVEPLAKRLEVTKGSFYWHFKNREDLLLSTLEYWEERWTDRGLARLAEIDDPRHRLRELFGVVLRRLDRGAVNISLHDSASDDRIRPVLERVTRKRIKFLETTYREMGQSERDAAIWALKAYATYVGIHEIYRVYRDPLEQDLDRFVEHILDALVPGEG